MKVHPSKEESNAARGSPRLTNVPTFGNPSVVADAPKCPPNLPKEEVAPPVENVLTGGKTQVKRKGKGKPTPTPTAKEGSEEGEVRRNACSYLLPSFCGMPLCSSVSPQSNPSLYIVRTKRCVLYQN